MDSSTNPLNLVLRFVNHTPEPIQEEALTDSEIFIAIAMQLRTDFEVEEAQISSPQTKSA